MPQTEAARLPGVHVNTIHNMLDVGRLPYVLRPTARGNRKRVLLRAVVEAYARGVVVRVA